ncbi:MAG: nitrogen regulation protein NR(II) [Proteobacteria bacterium]|nr:nitrogen regulation protein NR(II) [Pseudomonadota bacterium]
MSTSAFEILDNQSIALVVLTTSLQIEYLNPSAEALLGTSLKRSLGEHLDHLLISDDLFATLHNTLSTGQSFTSRETKVELLDGHELLVDLTATRMPGGSSALVELHPLNRLYRINQDDRNAKTQATTVELIRGLAHEIKNPLGGIRGAAQLLERELKAPGQTEYTNVIIREVDRLTSLVDQLLGPRYHADMKAANIHQVLEHVIQLVEAQWPDLIWKRDYDPSVPDVKGDEAMLIQAVLNVLNNAAQILQGRSHPCITIRSRAVRQFTIAGLRHKIVAQIDMIDNGPGIPAEILDQIFFPMISGRPDGTGLGLAITHNIIRQHKGIIEVNSKPGETCFSVFLPICERQIDAE